MIMKTNIYKTTIAFFMLQSVLIVILLNNNYMKNSDYLQSSLSEWVELLLGLVIVLMNLGAVIIARILYLSGIEAEQLKTTALKYNHMLTQNRIYQQHHHDLKNHLTVILGLLSQEKLTELRDYLQSYLNTVNDALLRINSGLDELDILLSAKIQDAKRNETEVKLIIRDPIQCSSKKVLDLVAIVGNVVDNALEAVKSLKPSQREATWSIRKDPVDYIFEFSNPLLLANQTAEGDFFEEGFGTKGEGRGHGLSITKKLTEKMEGTIRIDTSKGQFKVIIEIPRHKLER
ncbi:ATPase/histidine kinase/DNA gyrase B/HSP90 domain protein [Desulfitobacterium hafniense DP7]|uniref:ATPase/histidine kinase/DNA gyrase B/HSP90 domain protein n=2 Tax=Desulfitobacterium hafniense TaxID=49338 RepID=G9XSD6_DESHA|nr:ATPase/histidine kinase/DNA gyrase B/HSP90 domain protein [Desulfitobacterium hafniense DP7]